MYRTKAPASRVEQTRKNGRRGKLGQTKPIYGTSTRDERRGAAIADQAIGLDWRLLVIGNLIAIAQ
jgi:hypothetical protein